jgi:hypothetical protein
MARISRRHAVKSVVFVAGGALAAVPVAHMLQSSPAWVQNWEDDTVSCTGVALNGGSATVTLADPGVFSATITEADGAGIFQAGKAYKVVITEA